MARMTPESIRRSAERGGAAPLIFVVLLLLILGAAFVLFGSGSDGGLDHDVAAMEVDATHAPTIDVDAELGSTEREAPEAEPTETEATADEAAADEEAEEELDPTGLRGRAIGPNGLPAAGATARVVRWVAVREAAEFGVDPKGRPYASYEFGSSVADEEGYFDIRGVPAADGFSLSLSRDGGEYGSKDNIVVYEGISHDVGEIAMRLGAEVAGRVVDPRGKGIAGAEVTFSTRGSEPAVITDETGRFDAGVITPGRSWITVRAPGYALDKSRQREFIPGDVIDDLKLVMVSAAVIFGRVIDDQGGGVADVSVTASVKQQGFTLWNQARDSVQSNARGEFRFDTLPPGLYTVFADGIGFRTPPQEIEAGLAIAVELRVTQVAGDVTGVVVLDQDGSPTSGAEVELLWKYPWGRDSGLFRPFWRSTKTTSADDGSFSLSLSSEGTFRVKATDTTGELIGLSDPFEYKKGSVVQRLSVRLAPLASLSIRVLDGAGEPVPEAVTQIYANSQASPNRRQAGAIPAKPTGIDGVVVFHGLEAGSYKVVAQRSEHARGSLEQVQVGGTRTDVVDLKLGVGGSIEGKVRNNFGQVAPGVTVKAKGIEKGGGDSRETVSRDDGSYLIEHLLPGEYTVTASKEAISDYYDPFIWGSDEASAPKEPGIRVSEGESTHHDVTIDQVTPGSLVGALLINGTPAPDITVFASAMGPDGKGPKFNFEVRATTGPQGEFEFRSLDPGTYSMVAISDWNRPHQGGTVDIHAGVEGRMTIDLSVGTVGGRLVDEKGQPIAGARVNLRPAGDSPRVLVFGNGARSVETGNDGRFYFEEVTAGDHQLVINHRGFVSFEKNPIRVSRSREVVLGDIKLERGGWVELTLEGMPRTRATLEFLRTDGEQEFRRSFRTDENGVYWADLQGNSEGTLKVSASGKVGTQDVKTKKGENLSLKVYLQ